VNSTEALARCENSLFGSLFAAAGENACAKYRRKAAVFALASKAAVRRKWGVQGTASAHFALVNYKIWSKIEKYMRSCLPSPTPTLANGPQKPTFSFRAASMPPYVAPCAGPRNNISRELQLSRRAFQRSRCARNARSPDPSFFASSANRGLSIPISRYQPTRRSIPLRQTSTHVKYFSSSVK
jgi:hypothetical protein